MAFTNFHWYLESMKYFSIKIMQISNAFPFISLGMKFKGYKPKYIEIIIHILYLPRDLEESVLKYKNIF